MSSRGEKVVSPRVIVGVTAKIVKRVAAELEQAMAAQPDPTALPALSGGSDRVAPLSSEEQTVISTSVEHFLQQQRSKQSAVSECHLVELAKMLATSIAEKRKQSRTKPMHPPFPSASSSPRRPTDSTSHASPQEASSPSSKQVPTLPPLPMKGASPRQRRGSTGAASTSTAPFATADSVAAFQLECASHAASIRATRAVLSAELESQLREKDAIKERIRTEREKEKEARIDDLEHLKNVEDSVKKTKKQLNLLQSDEYTHYANLRSLDEQKGKLEKMLEDHLVRKQALSERSAEAALEQRRRKQAETASYLAMQSEQESARRKAAALEIKSVVAVPFFIGASEEEVRRKTQLRKISLAQGLEFQMQQQRAQQVGMVA